MASGPSSLGGPGWDLHMAAAGVLCMLLMIAPVSSLKADITRHWGSPTAKQGCLRTGRQGCPGLVLGLSSALLHSSLFNSPAPFTLLHAPLNLLGALQSVPDA